MKKRRPKKRSSNERLRVIKLWTQPQITKAFPYMRSIAQGLREHWLSAAAHGVHAERLANKDGRPNRHTLIALEEARDEKRRALDRFEESLEELNNLDVFCIDPVKGITWIPFRRGDELAWYIFDAFDNKGIIGWRLHSDEVEKIRPLDESTDEPTTSEWVA